MTATLVVVAPSAAQAAVGAWQLAGDMAQARAQFTLTTLADGRVLAAGGFNETATALRTAELFDPITQTWSPTGDMTVARAGHQAVLLHDGRVLVAGGRPTITNTAEVYNPVTGTWSTVGSMIEGRFAFVTTLLADGRVLATGGIASSAAPPGPNVTPSATAELFDPTTGTWSPTKPMANKRWLHRATRLADGRVLVTGGASAAGHCVMLHTAEVYDPAIGEWTNAFGMTTPRGFHAAALLPDGSVLVAGGYSLPVAGCRQFVETATALGETFDPATERWRPADSLSGPRGGLTAVTLTDRRILIVSGRVPAPGPGTVPTYVAEVYDPVTREWGHAGSLLLPHWLPAVTSLHDGRALAAGGADPSEEPVRTTEIFTPIEGA